MNQFFCTHDQNRKKVCAPCGRKIILHGKKLELFEITKDVESKIQKYIDLNYRTVDSEYPLSICGTCRKTLLELEKGITNRPTPILPNYRDISLVKTTRNSSQICYCYICLTARKTSHKKPLVGRGRIRQFNTTIDVSNGLDSRLNVNQTSSSTSTSAAKRDDSIKLCKKCFNVISKGKEHADCGQLRTVRNNTLDLVQNLPIKTQEQIALNILKRKNDELNDSNSTSPVLNIHSNVGRKTRIVINPEKKIKAVHFTQEKLDNFRVNYSASANDMKQVTNFIRLVGGRKAEPSNYREHVSQNSKILHDFYQVKYLSLIHI